jgi:hypothetical protein
VLVREISRSPVLQERIGELQQAFDALEHVIVRGHRVEATVSPTLLRALGG